MKIEITKIHEPKNGYSKCDIEIDDEAAEFIMKKYKAKKFSNKLLEKYIISCLKKYIKEEEKGQVV